MNNADKEYFRLAQTVLDKGRIKKNRTGIDTIGIFGEQAKFDLNEGFPILTTKKVFFKGIIHELLWFLSGSTNIKYLVDNDVHIWDDWAFKKYDKISKYEHEFNLEGIISASHAYFDKYDKYEFIDRIKRDSVFAQKWGELGEGTYGSMWRAFPFHLPKYGSDAPEETKWSGVDFKFQVDQIQKILDKLKTNPDDRRLIVSVWHPYWVDHCALPPCHCLFQFNTEELTLKERTEIAKVQLNEANIPTHRLNCQLYQRSCDLFLGVPFNIASYTLLTHMVAQVSNMAVGTFTHTYGDLHIYANHLEQIKLQMSRTPFAAPELMLNPKVKNLFDFKYGDIVLNNYQCHLPIKGEVAV